MKRMNRISAISGIMAAMMILLFGCATVPSTTDLNESLRLAAEKYWKLRLEGKYQDTYKMEEEGVPPLEEYRVKALGMNKLSINSIAVKGVSVDGNEGKVDLEWTYMLPKAPKSFQQIIRDDWVLKKREWRHKFNVK